jgi:twinkle protein
MVIALERNLSAGNNFSNIRVLKNRFNGQTGPAGAVAFRAETGRMEEDLTIAFSTPTSIPDDDAPF